MGYDDYDDSGYEMGFRNQDDVCGECGDVGIALYRCPTCGVQGLCSDCIVEHVCDPDDLDEQ